MKTKTITQPQRTCAFKKILSRMPPRSHWPDRSQKFNVTNSQVVWFIRNETGIKDWSRPMKIFYEASKNKVIVFDRNTGLWRGFLYNGKPATRPSSMTQKQAAGVTHRSPGDILPLQISSHS